MPPAPIRSSASSRVSTSFFIFFLCCHIFAISLLLTVGSSSAHVGRRPLNTDETGETNTSVNNPRGKVSDPVQNPTEKPEETALPNSGIFWSVPTAGNRVALTFDDGPSKEYTLKYLDILREKQVLATFFLIGRNVQSSPSLAALIAGEGHEIANHTYDHYLNEQSEAVIKKQILKTSTLLTEWTQQEIRYLRPPGGNKYNKWHKAAAGLNMPVVMWSVDPKDWEKNRTPAEIISGVKEQLSPGAIILLHEGKPQTLEALPFLIDELKDDGWKFVTISELLSLN